MTIRRITRERRLTPEEAAKYKIIREQTAAELPELIARHHERTAADKPGIDLAVKSKANEVQSSSTE